MPGPDAPHVPSRSPRLEALFRLVIAGRYWIVACFALLLPPSIYYGTRVPQDNSLDKLIVDSDPQADAARRFAAVFGGGEFMVLTLEADDPFSPAALARFDRLERDLLALPGVEVNSALGTFRRAKAGFGATPAECAAFREFATRTTLFRRQGLVGDHFLSLALLLDMKGSIYRNAARRKHLEAIGAVLDPLAANLAPFSALRRVGQPLVNSQLDSESAKTSVRYMPLFGLFVISLNLLLYRSWRALFAILLTLGVTAAMTLGFIGLTGGVFTIVSALVPMTVLITCTATLVYIHSRYVEMPEGEDPRDHHVFALANKFVACSASIFAGAVGFAALAVSKIKPIRDLGLWVAAGLLLTWIISFTLFPALQRIFRTPTMQERRIAGRWLLRYSERLPIITYRLRWVLVPGALLVCVAGVISLTGIPGLLRPMYLQTNALEYIDHRSDLYKDTRRLEAQTAGLSITEIWLSGGRAGSVTDPAVLRGLIRLEDSLIEDQQVGAVIGVPYIARLLRYIGGQGDTLPTDEAGLSQVADQLDSLLTREPMLSRFIDTRTLGATHLTVISHTSDYEGYVALEALIHQRWKQAVAQSPELGQFKLEVTGLSALQAKISYHLVPTLVESFGLSVVIIYGAFLLVFRNGLMRLLAMIPSVFAILGMFVFMRLTGISLNVATILIASTVLGTSENDQIHFFFHYQEIHRRGNTEEALRHTLLVVGRAILFATVINAGGFSAFTLANLPPIRQFGLLSAIAFLLSMLADFTALPAALWLLSRDKPASLAAGPHDGSVGSPRSGSAPGGAPSGQVGPGGTPAAPASGGAPEVAAGGGP